MLLHLHDLSNEPLHNQISRQVRAKVLNGQLPPETKLPSIRNLAKENKVSVITVQRAYEDLQREGVIQARRTSGYIVMPFSAKQKAQMASARLVEALEPIIKTALDEGLSPAQIKAVVDEFNLGSGV